MTKRIKIIIGTNDQFKTWGVINMVKNDIDVQND